MLDRRGILKMFGTGAIIMPVVEGSIIPAAAATLIEVPKIEVVSARMNGTPLNLQGVRGVSVTFQMRDGSTRTIAANSTWGEYGTLQPGTTQFNLSALTFDGNSPSLGQVVGRVSASGTLL